MEVISAELTWVPFITIELNKDQSNQVLKPVDQLEQDGDVQEGFYNLNLRKGASVLKLLFNNRVCVCKIKSLLYLQYAEWP